MKKYRLENHGSKPALFCESGIVCIFEAGHDQARHNDALAVLQSMNTDIPALLAALEAMVNMEDWSSEDIDPQSPIGKARAAIAKAKGEA